MIRQFVALCALALLTACGGADTFAPAPMVEVQRRAYVHDGPAEITLYTVIKTESGEGQHTALLINGSQRVLWDPAGSFRHPHVPERGDLHYGITERIRKVYVDYHVRDTHHVIAQTKSVSLAQADRLIALAAAHGSANRATCARSTSGMLREVGFDVGSTWFPNALRDDFGALPGVTSFRSDQSNVDTSHGVTFDPDFQPPENFFL
ncbi:hypothetical protein SAMN04488012_11194 [Palleronia salina]|uniref:Lipoprotein n=2 Tax=Palleronia TaxID=315422 RepID=A0A1M6KAN7_9RHOB|nr:MULTISPECIES: hypothetical protein [Palleronia]SEN02241.1 hypothetical protein SAMN04488011_102205 [Palleronia pelagia]SHJ55959.1 hypothetical protein SAMN04488012_11194 [Palleronia salina]